MIKLGSHSAADLAKLLPELQRTYEKTQQDVEQATEALTMARIKLNQARSALVEAHARLIAPLDEAARQGVLEAVQRGTQLSKPPEQESLAVEEQPTA